MQLIFQVFWIHMITFKSCILDCWALLENWKKIFIFCFTLSDELSFGSIFRPLCSSHFTELQFLGFDLFYLKTQNELFYVTWFYVWNVVYFVKKKKNCKALVHKEVTNQLYSNIFRFTHNLLPNQMPFCNRHKKQLKFYIIDSFWWFEI